MRYQGKGASIMYELNNLISAFTVNACTPWKSLVAVAWTSVAMSFLQSLSGSDIVHVLMLVTFVCIYTYGAGMLP